MKVMKKDGSLQDFRIEKIKGSIARASDDADQPFTQSDIENIAKTVEDKIMDMAKDPIKSKYVHDFVILELEKAGFHKVAQCYRTGRPL